ncbi:MAG: GNAT family N-acetyltransferase [Gemmatimonadales bacterium]
MSEASGAPRQTVEVVRAGPEHAGAMAEFFRATWSPGSTAERVLQSRAEEARSNPGGGGEEPPTFLWLADGKVLGYVSTIPGRIRTASGEHRAHWMKGLMVLPEHRNGPIGFMVLKEAVRSLGCTLSIAAAAPALRLFKALGFQDLGPIPNRLRVLEPGRLFAELDVERLGLRGLPIWVPDAVNIARGFGVSALVGFYGKTLTGGWQLFSRHRGRRLETGSLATPEEFDALWKALEGSIAGSPVRDSAYLGWRYDWSEGGEYRLATVREGERLAGFAVIREPRKAGDPRLAGIRLAVLSEFVFDPAAPGSGDALLRAVDRTARNLEADAILCSATHSKALPVLHRRGYLKIPGNIHLLQRDPGGECALPETLGDWWVTRGDGDADEAL